MNVPSRVLTREPVEPTGVEAPGVSSVDHANMIRGEVESVHRGLTRRPRRMRREVYADNRQGPRR